MRYARVKDGRVMNIEEWDTTTDPTLIADPGGSAVIGLTYNPKSGFESLPPEPEPAWIHDAPLVPDDPHPVDEAAYVEVLKAQISALEQGAHR